MSPDIILPDMTMEEYEKSGSKFAAEGNHLSECGMPEWETPGTSLRFPFTIIEEGEDNGKQNKLVCGVRKGASWKLKEMEKALGITLVAEVEGKPTIKTDALLACAGKQFLSVWTLEKDSRSPEEGGKGGTYTKPTSALPLEAKVEKLI